MPNQKGADLKHAILSLWLSLIGRRKKTKKGEMLR